MTIGYLTSGSAASQLGYTGKLGATGASATANSESTQAGSRPPPAATAGPWRLR